ncbi:MAG TPA: hypothetical protein ENK72_01060 [Epsilonproteobacteria bacterium]|nr:hypothetical protein [Campylobacterota bacterium]
MHTIKLNIDDSIYEKLMGLLEILPQDKIEVLDSVEYPSISFEDAKQKVERAVNNVDSGMGISLDDAFSQIIK